MQAETGGEFPSDIAGLVAALQAQRDYTLGLYRDLPAPLWEPARVPYLPTINPPLWELAHIAWFAEYFCLRYPHREPQMPPSRLAMADGLFDSAKVAHEARWRNAYPAREACFAYMREVLDAVIDALAHSPPAQRYYFQLALAHEDMHAEALAMTLATLQLPLPSAVPPRRSLPATRDDIAFEGGDFLLGDAAGRSFVFDNEKPARHVAIAPFAISASVVSAAEFAAFRASAAWGERRYWSDEGWAWRQQHASRATGQDADIAAMHINAFEAEAYCAAHDRRLPGEAEWEFAATHSAAFRASTGHVWEWTASMFAPYPGFVPDAYREYSQPWFNDHRVLKGGSFATHARIRYAQYRNFYLPARNDMFAGFRTCAKSAA